MHKQQDLIDFRERGGLPTLTKMAMLTPESTVWEVGVWKGDWIAEIAVKYNPYVLAFEPVDNFFKQVIKRFSDNPKINIMPFGLSDRNKTQDMRLLTDSTGVFAPIGEKVEVQLREINEVIAENRITSVDLLSCNCEGGEYLILPALCQSGNIAKFKKIMIQYHYYEPENIKQRNDIWFEMSKTHRVITYYPFIWEMWELK